MHISLRPSAASWSGGLGDVQPATKAAPAAASVALTEQGSCLMPFEVPSEPFI